MAYINYICSCWKFDTYIITSWWCWWVIYLKEKDILCYYLISLHTELSNKSNVQFFDSEINISLNAGLSATLSLTDDVVGAQGRLPCPPDLQSNRISLSKQRITSKFHAINISYPPYSIIKKFVHFITLARLISLPSLYLHRHWRHSWPYRTHIIWWWTSHTAVT